MSTPALKSYAIKCQNPNGKVVHWSLWLTCDYGDALIAEEILLPHSDCTARDCSAVLYWCKRPFVKAPDNISTFLYYTDGSMDEWAGSEMKMHHPAVPGFEYALPGGFEPPL